MREPEVWGETESDAKLLAETVKTAERLGLAAVLAIAAGLRLWRLDQNGFGNPYYAAAVRSMQASFTNFFFGSFDPAGFVTVDKPPVAIWIQALSAKLLGYTGFHILLPQAIMGVASVALVYHLVRRAFGAGPGLLAGLIMAITPIGVAVDRVNLPDTSLVLVLLLAAWALTIAVETARPTPLLVMAAFIGVGFNIKMLAAYVVLPTFYMVYLLCTQASWVNRLRNLSMATVLIVAVSLSWSIAVELTPKDQRPYIGGSTNNSAIELALGYNGLGRVLGGRGNMSPGRGGPDGMMKGAMPKGAIAKKAQPPEEEADFPPMPPPGMDDEPPFGPGGPGGGPPPGMGGGPPFGPGGPGPGGPMFGGMPGLMRFARNPMAGQITWLFPLAVLGTLAAVGAAGHARLAGEGRQLTALLLWAGWLGTHWVVFSFAQGIFHEYYTVVMGPPVAALAGVGAFALYRQMAKGGWATLWLPLTLVATAAWEGFLVFQFPTWRTWLLPSLGAGVGLGIVGLVVAKGRGLKAAAATIGILSLMIAPAAWSLTAVILPTNGMMPVASPPMAGGGPMMMGPPSMELMGQGTKELLAFLEANRHKEKILLMGRDSMSTGPLIIESGAPVVSMGGFMGGDPVITKDQFTKMVEAGEVRFVMVGGGPPGPPGGGGRRGPGGGGGLPGGGPQGPGSAGNMEIMTWVEKNGKEVDKALWQPPAPDDTEEDADEPPGFGPPGGGGPGGPGFFRRMQRSRKLFDCNPSLGWIKPATH